MTRRVDGKAVVRLNGTDVYLGPFGTVEAADRYNRTIAEWLANGRRLPRRDDPAEAPTTVLKVLAARRRVGGLGRG